MWVQAETNAVHKFPTTNTSATVPQCRAGQKTKQTHNIWASHSQ